MRLVMMGTGSFAVPTFEGLVASRHEVVGLVTRPAVIATGRRGPPVSPMRQAAVGTSLPVFEPENVNAPDSIRRLEAWQADVLVVCDYGQILAPAVLSTARCGGINLHGSLLPRYRGAAPVQWALIQGEVETGVTVIHMTPRLDAGPQLTQRACVIGPDENAVVLEERLARLGVDAVMEALERLEHWDGTSALGTPQDAKLATRAPRLHKADGAIPWTLPAEAIRNRVRGMVPWPGSYTHWSDERGTELRLIVQRASTRDNQGYAGVAGEIVHVGPQELLVMAGDGRLVSIEQVQAAGKRSMPVSQFLRGHGLRAGQRLGG
jgi:methionyl-tRNA formyltransferase